MYSHVNLVQTSTTWIEVDRVCMECVWDVQIPCKQFSHSCTYYSVKHRLFDAFHDFRNSWLSLLHANLVQTSSTLNRNWHRVCMGCVWNVHKVCMHKADLGVLVGVCMERPWNVHEICMTSQVLVPTIGHDANLCASLNFWMNLPRHIRGVRLCGVAFEQTSVFLIQSPGFCCEIDACAKFGADHMQNTC